MRDRSRVLSTRSPRRLARLPRAVLDRHLDPLFLVFALAAFLGRTCFHSRVSCQKYDCYIGGDVVKLTVMEIRVRRETIRDPAEQAEHSGPRHWIVSCPPIPIRLCSRPCAATRNSSPALPLGMDPTPPSPPLLTRLPEDALVTVFKL